MAGQQAIFIITPVSLHYSLVAVGISCWGNVSMFLPRPLDVGACCLSECDLGNIGVMSYFAVEGAGGKMAGNRKEVGEIITELNGIKGQDSEL